MDASDHLEKMDDSPLSPTSPSIDDRDHLQRTATGQHHDGGIDKASLARTKSIAEKLSLPHEIAFVSLVCMAQFFTREYEIRGPL